MSKNASSIAYHEAGHILAAKIYYAKILEARVSPTDGAVTTLFSKEQMDFFDREKAILKQEIEQSNSASWDIDYPTMLGKYPHILAFMFLKLGGITGELVYINTVIKPFSFREIPEHIMDSVRPGARKDIAEVHDIFSGIKKQGLEYSIEKAMRVVISWLFAEFDPYELQRVALSLDKSRKMAGHEIDQSIRESHIVKIPNNTPLTIFFRRLRKRLGFWPKPKRRGAFFIK
jgi:hypothetical protein